MNQLRRFKAKVSLSVSFGAVAYEGGRLSDNLAIDNPLELPIDWRGRELDFVHTESGRCVYEPDLVKVGER